MACKSLIFSLGAEARYCIGTAKPCRSGRVRRGRVYSRLSARCARPPAAGPARAAALNALAGPGSWGSLTPNDPDKAATVSDADPIAPTRPYFSTRRPSAPTNPYLGECASSLWRPLDHEASRRRARCPRAHAATISVLRLAGIPQTSRRPLSGSGERACRLLASARPGRQGTRPGVSGKRASAAPTLAVLQQAASSGHGGRRRLRPVDRDAAGGAKAAVVTVPIHVPSSSGARLGNG
jgi:hypothetical protein